MKKFKFIIDGIKYEVSVDEIEQNVASIEVNGTPFTVEIEREQKVLPTAPLRPIKQAASAPQSATCATEPTKSDSFIVKSPLPGSVMKVLVTVGQSVKRGDVLLTMESMKMENNILAEKDGVIKALFVEPGKNVLQDDKLVEMESSETVVAPAPKPAASTAPKAETPKAEAPKAAPTPVAGGFKVRAPLPGSVLKVVVTEGQSVKRGDVLLTLESMKMENSILAEKDGVVRGISVEVGKNVQQDDVLLVLE
ncbi:MAG: biotin/lipoyl-binding protein [Bacteroidota bacterium]|jgi:biotin carboxyl carrier protein|nr:biotin/lipoyl-binding protein [Bacteroidota bacterium]HOO23547.1 biotin/lipoyl-binding protein [Paludibacteraceae bacterium]HQO48366.1 biotin/lipoyl-binding protein [Paludibacteraceae bacterium]HQP80359.1 biotin/lipoyl-binding protein [Paludibacteraceae bacterium]HRR57970.1 biotin/lipoyl-binding protein [Paludibacteraceae bacterium]